MKAAGLGLDEIKADDAVLVDEEGGVVYGNGRRHSEWPLHTEIMAARHDAGAIVHTHPPHATALAAAGQPLRVVSNLSSLFVPPDVPRFDLTSALIQSRERGRQVVTVLGERDVLFLVNHGVVTVGTSVRDAVVRAVLLEKACRAQLLTQAFGDSYTEVAREESLEKRATLLNRLDTVWEYLVRRLNATDPPVVL